MNVKGTKFTDLEHRITEYTGSLKYSNRAGVRLLVNYDRNEREESRNEESDYVFANCLEARKDVSE